MKKQTKNLLLGTGIAAVSAAAAAVASYELTGKLVSFALDRDEPKTIGKIRRHVFSSNVDDDTREALTSAAQALENSGGETIEITSHDGQKLTGHWCPCENPRRIILAMHGWRSSWSADFGIIADFWRDSGCSVLYAEQRAQNSSDGDYMGMGMLEQYDCLDWIRWLSEENGTDLPLYLAGVSMGATTVLLAADLSLPAHVRGIIADCGFTSPDKIWEHFAGDMLHLPYRLYSKAANSACERKINMETTAFSTVEVMKNCRIPVLFIHGTMDPVVPVEMTYENFAACTAPKEIFIVPGAGHGASYLVDRKGYETMLKAFWGKYDSDAQQGPQPTV